MLFSLPADAHVQHYDDLKRIEFDIYRNNKHIGKHIFSFSRSDEQLAVESEINFKIKKLGMVFYKYHVNGKEIYKDGELITFNSKTNQNGKKKYVNMKLKNGEYIIEDRKSTRLNSSHKPISYAVFCLKKKKKNTIELYIRQK